MAYTGSLVRNDRLQKNMSIVKEFLAKNYIPKLPAEDQLRETVKIVARIPWGEGRTIEETLETKRVGTCTGKHAVLGACLDEFGIDYKNVVCTLRWEEQTINYPENLKKILAKGGWNHGHNFLMIRSSVKWIDVDITWDPLLRHLGFWTLPETWDGTKPFIGVRDVSKRWDDVDAKQKKEELINSLSPEVKSRREEFLEGMFSWIKDYREGKK